MLHAVERGDLPLLRAARASVAPPAAASEAGLAYVRDDAPGIRRIKRGNGFSYVGPNGARIGADDLRRIRSLAIPPAWTDVWICPRSEGHIQATGRDIRGRKQYRYHPRWRAVRDATKFHRMLAFASKLPAIRERVEADLAQPGLSREKVLATVLFLLETTLIRVGNEEYARENGSYGLTTLRDRHVDVRGATLHFHFRAKGGKLRVVEAHDRRVARVVRRCQELPGHELFHYPDEAGVVHPIGSADVNAYLRDIAGEEFTAKDYRTWFGTLLAARALRLELGEAKPTKRAVMRAIEAAAERLGNTVAICRKCYVHPDLLECYLAGQLAPLARAESEERALAKLLARWKRSEALHSSKAA